MIVDMKQQEYLALDRASSHRLWEIRRSPKKMKWEALNPRPQSESMKTGTALHALLLEGREPLSIPKNANRRSNEGKQNLVSWLEGVTGHKAPYPTETLQTPSARLEFQIVALEKILNESNLVVLAQEQYDKIYYMRDSVMNKPSAQIIFDSGKPEVTCLQDDPVTEIEMKCRFDWLLDHYSAFAELKATRNIDPSDFQRDFEKYGYWFQTAFYHWMYELEFQKKPTVFVVAVENIEPYDSVIYEVGEDSIKDGEESFREALDIYAKCSRERLWPGYDWDWNSKEHEILTLNRPRWAK